MMCCAQASVFTWLRTSQGVRAGALHRDCMRASAGARRWCTSSPRATTIRRVACSCSRRTSSTYAAAWGAAAKRWGQRLVGAVGGWVGEWGAWACVGVGVRVRASVSARARAWVLGWVGGWQGNACHERHNWIVGNPTTVREPHTRDCCKYMLT